MAIEHVLFGSLSKRTSSLASVPKLICAVAHAIVGLYGHICIRTRVHVCIPVAFQLYRLFERKMTSLLVQTIRIIHDGHW